MSPASFDRLESLPAGSATALGKWLDRDGRTGLLVVGHGTADPVGAEETRAVARGVAELLPGVAVELGFLEVIGPSIDDAVRSLAARGCREAVAAPLLLFTAGHARRDVPEALVEAARVHRIEVVQSAAFGCHRDLVELARGRRREALAGLEAVPDADAVLVMIGRGSSAPDAVGQLREFAAATRRDGDASHADVELGFVAAARPTVHEALATAVARGPQRIIVQPHLLFRGHVEEQVTAAVARFRAEHAAIEWVEVPRLGPDRLVSRALVDRATAALEALVSQSSPLFLPEKNVSPELP